MVRWPLTVTPFRGTRRAAGEQGGRRTGQIGPSGMAQWLATGSWVSVIVKLTATPAPQPAVGHSMSRRVYILETAVVIPAATSPGPHRDHGT